MGKERSFLGIDSEKLTAAVVVGGFAIASLGITLTQPLAREVAGSVVNVISQHIHAENSLPGLTPNPTATLELRSR